MKLTDIELDGKIIYQWENPASEDYRNKNNEAEGYIVVENKEASSGVIIYGKFGDDWEANPWSLRPLVRQLQAEAEIKRIIIEQISTYFEQKEGE